MSEIKADLRFLILAGALILMFQPYFFSQEQKPNIVIILTDDQGYADISFNLQHPIEVHTPNMDSLANEGIVFTQAYISGNTCAPTRAGLMTGRYQHRAGIYTSGEGGSGLPLEEIIMPQFLTPAGYVCGAFGKWHLGLTPEYNPVSRGFDEFYGFMGRGAHDYFMLDDPESPLYRGLTPVQDEGYLTNRLTEEAISFIKQHKDQPFLLYLAFNAVHTPAQAPAEDIADFDTGDPLRDTLMAMLRHLDWGVGDVVRTLKQEGLWENTLFFFLTDNGGAAAMHAINTPLRDFKQSNYEGGIRTPFIVSWPARFTGGRSINTPVISLDILPTILDAAGIEQPAGRPFDGKSILPLLDGQTASHHEKLFWSEGGGNGEWAVRSGRWKLVVHKAKLELFDLVCDISETTDLSATYPDTLEWLIKAYDQWLDQMAEPLQEPGKRWYPSIQDSLLASLYPSAYFRGGMQGFDSTGIYFSNNLVQVEPDQTSSILVADGYDVMAFSDDSLGGETRIITSSLSSLGTFDDRLSSMVIYREGNLDLRRIDITASAALSTAAYTRDGNLATYWDCTGEGEWIRYSFCRMLELTGLEIAFHRGNKRVTYFDAEVSMDGESWFPVLVDASSNGIQITPERFDFPVAAEANHLRIIGKGNSDNRQNQYSEIGFFYLEIPVNGLFIEAEDFTNSNGVKRFIADDCTSLLAIRASHQAASAAYAVDLASETTYHLQIRIRIFQSGSIDCLLDGSLVQSIAITPSMISDEWQTIEDVIDLPAGKHILSFSFISSVQGTSFEVNWFELGFMSRIHRESSIHDQVVRIFPNPFNEELIITSSDVMGKVSILDSSGRLLVEQATHENRYHFYTGSLNTGIYIVLIQDDSGVQCLKAIKFE